jgi:hypothetical protein
MNKEEAEKRVPKTYEEAMGNPIIASVINAVSLWGKFIHLGFVKDLKEVEEYQKKLYEEAIREHLIKQYMDKG